MVNHFSKYGWIVLISNKNATAVWKAIKSCIAKHDLRDSLQTYNKSEFIKKS